MARSCRTRTLDPLHLPGSISGTSAYLGGAIVIPPYPKDPNRERAKRQTAASPDSACPRLGLSAPAQGTAKLFHGNSTGLQKRLPGCQFQAVIDTLTAKPKS